MRLFCSLIISILAINFCNAASDRRFLPSEELSSLDKVIRQADKLAENFESKVVARKKYLIDPKISSAERLKVLMEISDLYRPHTTDSALAYASKAVRVARESGDEKENFLASLTLSDALASAGFFSDALLKYDSLDVSGRDKMSKIRYFIVGRRLYSNLSNYAEGQGLIHELYLDKYAECDDSLVSLLPHDNLFHTFIQNERLVDKGKYNVAKTGLEELLAKLNPEENLYGMTAFQLSRVYRSIGDQKLTAAYLAKAAESDIRSGVRECFALPALAAWLYEHGEFDNAFKYINFALEEANKGDARVRMVSMAGWVPLIDEAYRREISASRNELILYVVIVSLLVLALGVLVTFLFKEVRKSKKIQKALSVESRAKDAYIGNFIGLCSTYSEQYYSLVKLVDRKISSGQSAELVKMLKSGKIVESTADDFYKIIDSVILNLYPDFVEKINGLLKPDEQIILPPESRELNPELRIYAFVRLGVTESTKIARILNYSVNTVYAYRNRMRNRALNRDSFENDIAK